MCRSGVGSRAITNQAVYCLPNATIRDANGIVSWENEIC